MRLRHALTALCFASVSGVAQGCWFDLVPPEDVVETRTPIASDSDDVMWTYCHEPAPAPTLSSSHPETQNVFVSDSDNCAPPDEACDECAGFRFAPAIPAGATILQATLVLTADVIGDDNATANQDAPLSLQLFVYDALDVGFDETSSEPPEALGQRFPAVVWEIGNASGQVETPDLREYVQQLVDRDDYAASSILAFYLDGAALPTSSTYFGFVDSSAGAATAELVVRYLPAAD